MIICFGLSWPFSIHKSWVSQTAKGKSIWFECLIEVGYIFGIIRKLILHMTAESPQGWLFYLAWFFYVLNFAEIAVDMLLYRRNRKLDAARERQVV